MSKVGGAIDLASGVGGKMEKRDVLSAVEKYDVSLSTFCLSSVVIVELQTNLSISLSF
jgi:hypothetical protein